METQLSAGERKFLLEIARETMESAVTGKQLPQKDPGSISERCRQDGASFVTLTIEGDLRGCIGTLEAFQPLYLDVQEHAVQAALEDHRFPPVSREELPLISIEISHLTAPVPLAYFSPQELAKRLNPHVDGVILRDGYRRATFLPQVWDQLPDPGMFLAHLCQKMGAAPDLWRRKVLDVSIYHVEEFSEQHK